MEYHCKYCLKKMGEEITKDGVMFAHAKCIKKFSSQEKGEVKNGI